MGFWYGTDPKDNWPTELGYHWDKEKRIFVMDNRNDALQWFIDWVKSGGEKPEYSNGATTSDSVGSGTSIWGCWYDPKKYFSYPGAPAPAGGWPDPVWICDGPPPDYAAQGAGATGIGVVEPGFQGRGWWIHDAQNGNGNGNGTDYKPFLIAAAATILAAFIVTRKR